MSHLSILRLYIASALLAASFTMSAQPIKVNTRFDRVSPAEIEMKTYEPDTAASAVVLLDVGRTSMGFDPKGRLHLKINRHERIKVLKEEGVSYADYEFIYHTKLGAEESIGGINAVTYNMEDGNIVKTKMSKKYIFDEELTDNYRKVSFSAENVKAGSVIDVEYTITSYVFWDFDKIYFQRTIPVNMFSHEVRIPEYVGVNKRVSGYARIEYSSDAEVDKFHTGTQYIDYRTNIDRYKGTGLPAMKKEPYSYSYTQYLSGVDYDISYIDFPGMLTKHFSVKWEDVDKKFYESSVMSRMNEKCLFPEGVRRIMDSEDNDEQKIMAIHNLVRSEISWNGKYKLYPAKSSQVYREQTGSNADLNAITGSCLKAAGYTVEPVLIKRRSEGILIPGLAELNPYSTYILRIGTAGGRFFYLDCGSRDLYLDILPPDLLVSSARILRAPGSCEWVDLTNLIKNVTGIVVSAKLEESGRMTGEISAKYTGEECYAFKQAVSKAGSGDDYITYFENANSMDIAEYEFGNTGNPSKVCSAMYRFEKDNDVAGSRIYVSPFVTRFHSDSDFSPLTRTCPVEFPYRRMINYVFKLELPGNCRLEYLPEKISIGLPCLKSACTVSHQVSGQIVNVVFSFVLSEMISPVEDYQSIREFWQNICEVYNEVLVISRTEE